VWNKECQFRHHYWISSELSFDRDRLFSEHNGRSTNTNGLHDWH
jgi:hypothetical protein